MSHTCGRVVSVGTRIGPDSGSPPSPAGVWEFLFTPSPALMGGPPRFVMLHFSSMSFPGTSRLEVDVRYGTDTLAAASGADAWTRPVDPLPGPIRIRYFGSGTSGGVTLAEYGSGEPTQTGTPGDPFGSLTNVDLFLHTSPYTEPIYESRLKCGGAFDWQNAACAASGSVEESAAKQVCCFVCVHRHGAALAVSTCSGTLIDNNIVLTAAHCLKATDDLEARSGSVCFGYQTACSPSTRPPGYAPKIFKVTRIIRRGSADWLLLEIDAPPGGTGITPAQLRSSGVVTGEQVIAIHHPHGAVKKFQRRALVANTVFPVAGFDFAGGSSGSALFDSAGRIVGGALSSGPLGSPPDACSAGYTPATAILQELANPPVPPAPFDVVLVMDRSGSMSAPGLLPGRTKMQEARDAASLFVQLVRTGGGDRLGLVSFSTAAGRPPDSSLGNADAAKKTELVGPPPYSTGRVGALSPGGMTSIGDGLAVALGALGPAGTNQRAILLMTDGLQNTPPMIADVEGGLGGTKVVAIGFGAESDLDSALLSRVARAHNGLYTRANDGLELKKFFSLAFGNIFAAGALTDPEVVLRESEQATQTFPFDVCDEARITAIVGWDRPTQDLILDLTTPAGATVSLTAPGVETDRAQTWHFARVPLPFNGEREGTWQWSVRRLGGGGEFPPPAETVRLFVNVIADGGPRLEPVPETRRLYTGDSITPLVALRYENGSAPHAHVALDVETPDAAVGEIVRAAGLSPPDATGDPVSGFHATLRQLGAGQPYHLPTRRETIELFDDGEHGDGAMEPDGVYGNQLAGVTRFEGTYRFHATATYGDPCPGRREAQWAIQVALGIDPDRSMVVVTDFGRGPDGRHTGQVVITPRDRYGNPLGPGRPEEVPVTGQPGTTVTGVTDNGDGSYSVGTSWDPTVPGGPAVVVTQPDRPPVVVSPRGRPCPRWLWWLLALLIVLLLIAVVVIVWLAV
jgi:hypothetical protein